MNEIITELYNAERKQRYFDENYIAKSNYLNLLRLFKKSTVFENTYDRDISEWSATEGIAFLKFLNTGSVNTLVVYRSLLTSYTQWCLQNNLVESGQNNWQLITQNVLRECINKQKNVVLIRQEVLDICRKLKNDGDAFLLLGLFEGIGSYGKQWEELANARRQDIDQEKNTIRLCTGRVLEISNELKYIAIEASKAKIIYTGSRDYPVSPDEPYDLIIKTKKRRNAEDNPYRKGVRCFVRLNKFMNEFGYSLTAANIENSGKIEYLNQCADEAGMSVEDWLEIKENEQKFIDRFNNYNKGKRAFLSENEEYLI